MNDEQTAQAIRASLRESFPNTVFQVTYHNPDLQVLWMGGDDGKKDYPTQTAAVQAMTAAIRRVIPDYQPTDWE